MHSSARARGLAQPTLLPIHSTHRDTLHTHCEKLNSHDPLLQVNWCMAPGPSQRDAGVRVRCFKNTCTHSLISELCFHCAFRIPWHLQSAYRAHRTSKVRSQRIHDVQPRVLGAQTARHALDDDVRALTHSSQGPFVVVSSCVACTPFPFQKGFAAKRTGAERKPITRGRSTPNFSFTSAAKPCLS